MPLYQKHIFYSEGVEDFKLILRPIVDVRKQYFETTLLEALQISPKCDYQNLQEATTVRIAPYVPAKCLYASSKVIKISPAVKFEEKDSHLSEWIDFKYSGKNSTQEYLRNPGSVIQTHTNRPALIQITPAVQPPVINRANIERWRGDVFSLTSQSWVGLSSTYSANSRSTKSKPSSVSPRSLRY
jgi:hypothetical protein